jgi:hypothetical protein
MGYSQSGIPVPFISESWHLKSFGWNPVFHVKLAPHVHRGLLAVP